MAKKKKKSKPTLSPSLFKITGPDAKLKTKAAKKLFYFAEKIKPDKAVKLATDLGAEALGTTSAQVKAGKPALKYDFYINCDALVEKKLLSVRQQEIGVQNEMVGALVGKEVIKPKKGKEPPLRRIEIDIVELFEIKRQDAAVYDGKSGYPARAMEKLVKRAGRKAASKAWVRKAKIAPGKFNTLEKFLKVFEKNAAVKPGSIKKVASQTLTFKKLEGVYIPTYYVTVTFGAKKQVVRVNAVNGSSYLG